jgi:hypothetical protein
MSIEIVVIGGGFQGFLGPGKRRAISSQDCGFFRLIGSPLDINNGPNLDLLEQGKNVGIVHSKTSIGGISADCLGPVCPVDAIGPVAKDQDSDAKRIVRAGFYESRKAGIFFSNA